MTKRESTLWDYLGLAWELGYLIALPLVGFALLGRFADRYFESSPFFLLVGIILAIAISCTCVVRKVSRILRDAVDEEGEEGR